MTTASVAPTAASPSPFSVFRKRDFSLIWSGQLISTIGSSLTSLASSILVYRITGSALSVGLMLMATAAPSLLVGLVAGVVVDRYDRKKIMIAADILRAVLVFLIPFIVPHGIAWLYVIVMLSSSIGQFYDPAHESTLPDVASDKELASANSLMAISSFGSTAVGFAASGLIASRFPIEWAFYLDAVSFLISAGCILFLRVRTAPIRNEASEATGVGMVVSNLKAGINTLIKSPILRSIFVLWMPATVVIGLSNSLLLPFALRALKATEFEYGLQEGITSLGFVFGSLLMATLAARLREGQWIALSFVGMGLAGAVYSFSQSVPLAMVIVAVSGFTNAPLVIARRLIFQRNTPREMRGRVASSFAVTNNMFFLIGMATAGLADLIDVRLLYLGSSIVLLGCAAWALVMPGLRQDAVEWRRVLRILHASPSLPNLGKGREASSADFDRLVGLLPLLGRLSPKDRQALISKANVFEAPAETTLIHAGEAGEAAFFLLAGQAAAGISLGETDEYRSLSTMGPGDFFGEIAALTGSTRTATVVASEPVTLFQIPAASLRAIMLDPALSRLFLSKMSERLARTSLGDLPRFAGLDQQSLRDLRSPEGELE
jgi:CRP-like cAMP-binding protein/sugar phosphate permease